MGTRDVTGMGSIARMSLGIMGALAAMEPIHGHASQGNRAPEPADPVKKAKRKAQAKARAVNRKKR